MLVIFDPCKKCLVKACCSLTCIEKVHNNLLKEKLRELRWCLVPLVFILINIVMIAIAAYEFFKKMGWV